MQMDRCDGDVIMGFPREFPMGAAICMKLSCLYMYVHVHVCGTPPQNTLTESHQYPPTNTPKGGRPLKSVKSE